jgi:hypothetical protein
MTTFLILWAIFGPAIGLVVGALVASSREEDAVEEGW